jgi:ArsR family transcriptional regulator
MSFDTLDIKVKMIKSFADKTRLRILDCLNEKEKTVSQIVNEIEGNQSNISQHLACLKGCGIIVGRQEGKFMYYSIRDEQVRTLLNMFDLVLGEVEEQVADCDKNAQLLPHKGMCCNG